MLIKKINISNFGKLSDINVFPDEGLNVIYTPNEGGKTTFLSFFKYIFYGLKHKKAYKDLTFKERYMPWNSLPMSGSCEFSTDSGEYIIQRTDSDTVSKLSVINLKSGAEDNRNFIPGTEFFKMGERAFSDSFFINELTNLIDFSNNGEIFSMLSDSCNEQNTYHKVKSELQEKLAQLVSPKRKASSLEIINSKILDCEMFQIIFLQTKTCQKVSLK